MPYYPPVRHYSNKGRDLEYYRGGYLSRRKR